MSRTHTLLVLLTATTAVVGAAAQAPDRSKPPAVGTPPSLRLPQIQKRTLTNGLAVWLVEQHEVPVVQVDLVERAGGAADPPGKFGLASLTAAMLDEGAGQRDALEIADEIEFLGAELVTASSFDASRVRVHVPAARLAQALPIMADVVLRPTFPAKELDRLREERLTHLLQARDDPASVASVGFPRLVYGPGHRYGIPDTGTAETLRVFTVEDLRGFHAAHYRPDRAALVVVGDTTLEGVLPLIESSFGPWKAAGGATPAVPALPPAPQLTRREVLLIDRPGAAQSQVRIGWIGVPRSTPDYFALAVLNTILGGSFGSRLNQNLREQHGYTYGAGSVFDMRISAGPFVAAAGVQTDKTAEALTEFFKELNGIRQPVPADELAKVKNYLALRFPQQFETTRNIAGRLVESIIYGLPEDYFATYVDRIQAVTAEEVRRAAERYIQPDRFAVVIAGDRLGIEAKVRALNLGPLKLLTVDEVMGPK